MNTETNVTDTQTETGGTETENKQNPGSGEEAKPQGEASEQATAGDKSATAQAPETEEQKRRNREAYERRQEKKRLRELEIENARLQGFNEALKASGKTAQTATDTAQPDQLVEPNPDSFDNHADYVKAVADYASKKAIQTYEANQQKKNQEQTVKQQQEQAEKVKTDFISKGVKEYGEDFAEELTSPDLKISMHMKDSLLDSEIGPKLAKHLIDNPEVAAKIAAMSPVRQIKEMLALETTIKAAAAKQTTKAPDPITDVKGSGKQPDGEPPKDMAEYAKWRQSK